MNVELCSENTKTVQNQPTNLFLYVAFFKVVALNTNDFKSFFFFSNIVLVPPDGLFTITSSSVGSSVSSGGEVSTSSLHAETDWDVVFDHG